MDKNFKNQEQDFNAAEIKLNNMCEKTAWLNLATNKNNFRFHLKITDFTQTQFLSLIKESINYLIKYLRFNSNFKF